MNNTRAFCAQLVEYFIRCEECGEAICADHRTAKPALVAQPAGVRNQLADATLYLCLNHRRVAPYSQRGAALLNTEMLIVAGQTGSLDASSASC